MRIDILGKENMPESLSKFQDLKYNDIEKYERLKDKAYIQNNFNRGIWKDEINPEKQARHIKSTAGKTKSYFYDDIDIEALYNKYKMTGYIQPYGNGVNSSDEKVDLYEANPVGIDIFTGNVVNAMTIKYGKTGSHLIPTYY